MRGAQPPSDPLTLPDRLAAALQAAHTAETAATGAARRPAMRLTRGVIGGIVEAGYSTRAIADCLGVTSGSVRSRASLEVGCRTVGSSGSSEPTPSASGSPVTASRPPVSKRPASSPTPQSTSSEP
jgi:hypothetical protein